MFHTSQTRPGTQSPVPVLLQCMFEDLDRTAGCVELRSHVANQVYVVIEVAYKVIRDIMCRSASVPDKLPLGHFVFDVGAGEVDGQQDQTVAQHIHGIRTEAQVSDKARVTGTKPVAELGDEGFQILSSLLRCVDVSEEIPQSVGEELVTEVMEGHQLVEDVPPLIQVNPQHLPVEPSRVEDELSQLCRMIH